MEMFSNFKFVQDIARELIQPRPCNYMALDIWKHITKKDQYHYENPSFQIPGQRTISLHMIQNDVFKSIQNQPPSTCIVYLHGLSSFSVEGTFLVQNLEKYLTDLNVSACLYDLRGHGKDKAHNVTFGTEQSKQLYQILLYLKQYKNCKQFVLWGRSMGATTILKMTNDFHQELLSQQIHIKYLILDSAFCSIEKVATEIIARKSLMPQIFCKPVFEYLISTVQKIYRIRLNVDITNLQNLSTNALFLYSQIDNLVSAEHSKILYEKYSGPKQKMELNVGHNDQRPENILSQVFQKLIRCLKYEPKSPRKKSLSVKKIGLSVTKSKRVKTNQSIFQGGESYITQNMKTQEGNKENIKNESITKSNKSREFSKMQNSIILSPNVTKIAKDKNIKQLKLTKKFTNLNGNIKQPSHLFEETEINSSQLKDRKLRNSQKLKLSHKEIITFKSAEFNREEPRHKTSIYEKAYEKKPQDQIDNLNAYNRFKEVKSAFMIGNRSQAIENQGQSMKQDYMKKKYKQNELIGKKLCLNRPSDKPQNCCNWTTNHITSPTQKPQSSTVKKIPQKRMSYSPCLSIPQKEGKDQLRLGERKNLGSLRKSIDLELLKIQSMSPIYHSCIVTSNVTPQNKSQKVVFNFQPNQPKKMAVVQRLSNQHYM